MKEKPKPTRKRKSKPRTAGALAVGSTDQHASLAKPVTPVATSLPQLPHDTAGTPRESARKASKYSWIQPVLACLFWLCVIGGVGCWYSPRLFRIVRDTVATLFDSSDGKDKPSDLSKSAPNPADRLRDIIVSIPHGEVFHTTVEDWREWYKITYNTPSDEGIQEQVDLPYDFYASSRDYNVETTNSLISPYVGTMYIYAYVQHPGYKRGIDAHYRILLAWQNNDWVVRKVLCESSIGEGTYREPESFHPSILMLKRALSPYVRWNLAEN